MANHRFTSVPIQENDSRFLLFLYENALGRLLLKVFSSPWVSKCGRFFMNKRISKPYISRFIRKNNISLENCEKEAFSSFNDFFTRRQKEILLASKEESIFLSPCDGKLTAYEISETTSFTIKKTSYTISELLKAEALSKEYEGGIALLFRLTPDDYHRYMFMDDGVIEKTKKIKGRLHTVRPIALKNKKVFSENTREYTVLQTAHFGKMVFMEVGALLIGKISNHKEEGSYTRGEEKGYFEFGGSTILLLLKKDTLLLHEEIYQNTARYEETIVSIGQEIGRCEKRL